MHARTSQGLKGQAAQGSHVGRLDGCGWQMEITSTLYFPKQHNKHTICDSILALQMCYKYYYLFEKERTERGIYLCLI